MAHERGRLQFIADIAANHDGSLDRALRLIELAHEAGADVAKFQHFRAETIVSRRGFSELGANTSHQSNWRASVYETYEKYALPYEWTEPLASHCKSVGIEFMSTPYDFEAADLIAPFVTSFKIGSGDLNWHEFLAYVAAKGKPVLLATGASSWPEVEAATSVLNTYKIPITLMQCNTNYTGDPSNLRHLNLRAISQYRVAFPEAVLGLSDHTKDSVAITIALALGATTFERHFTDDSSRSGPDHGFSLEPSEWRSMVESARDALDALGSGDKVVEDNETASRVVQRRAVRYARNLRSGETVSRKDLRVTRPCPGDSIDASRVHLVLGRVLAVDVPEDALTSWEDFRG